MLAACSRGSSWADEPFQRGRGSGESVAYLELEERLGHSRDDAIDSMLRSARTRSTEVRTAASIIEALLEALAHRAAVPS